MHELEKIYRKNRKRLIQHTMKMRLPEEVAEELVHEAFLRAWNRPHSIQFVWLVVVIRNLIVDLKRKRREAVTLPIEFAVAIKCERHQSTERMQVLAMVQHYLMQYEHRDESKVAYRFYFLGERTKSIAQSLGLKENTVLSHLHRFRRRMAKEFGEGEELFDDNATATEFDDSRKRAGSKC